MPPHSKKRLKRSFLNEWRWRTKDCTHRTTTNTGGCLRLEIKFLTRKLMLYIALKACSIAFGINAVIFSGGFLFHITTPMGALWTWLWLTVVWNYIRNLEMIHTTADGLRKEKNTFARLSEEGKWRWMKVWSEHTWRVLTRHPFQTHLIKKYISSLAGVNRAHTCMHTHINNSWQI